eukprot:CAMPEP_0194689348 /NCGR_PEP_ID=MMETSP0295-20121207/17542_1 /TAXON_ID=39354 /ORGANISM="Heterosigma akashiwo, Strain CCMP2393" /LENGTH=94 /DNA_ID=CAMNT_0039578341 /DNA_START=210 /DNA_END=496 /DNA_ORIENTATION=-
MDEEAAHGSRWVEAAAAKELIPVYFIASNAAASAAAAHRHVDLPAGGRPGVRVGVPCLPAQNGVHRHGERAARRQDQTGGELLGHAVGDLGSSL